MKKLMYGLGALLVVAIFSIYLKYDPELYILFPKCVFHSLTGLDCPGCGSQRAIHALLAGNIVGATNYNLLFVGSLPLLTLHFGTKAVGMVSKKDLKLGILYKPVTPVMIGVIVVLFWILRNIPIYPFNVLAA